MRKRMLIVIVALVSGALIAAGLGTLAIARISARHQATTQLIEQATDLADRANEVHTMSVLAGINEALKLQGGRIIGVSPGGGILTPLPGGIVLDSAQGQQLLNGKSISGLQGGTAFAVVPVSQGLLVPRLRGLFVAVMLTRQTGAIGPSSLYWLLVTGVILVVAVALAVWLSRRITGPLVDAAAVTERVARGELSARVETRPGEIPELVTLAHSINSMAERLEGTRERERQMLLSVSHDLRTPLTSIRGYAEAIQEGVADDTAKAATVIVSESKRLERLVADLLDLTRLEMSALSLRIAPTEVAPLVSQTVAGFLPGADSRRLSLRTEVARTAEPVLVSADPDRLAQVVGNLVSNALAYAATTIVVGVEPSAGGARISVTDDGPGISPKDLPRVFERFYQGDRRSSHGSGLGLAIVSELLRAMGGHIEAESPSGPAGGTRMVVWLPGPGVPSGAPSAHG